MARILVKFPYETYLEATAAQLDMLLKWPKYSREGFGDNEKFHLMKEDNMEQIDIKYPREDKFPDTDTELGILDIEAILAENTRLTREKDILQAAYDKLVNKTGTELQLGDN